MITLTKEQLINYIELLAREVYSENSCLIKVDEDDYCYVCMTDSEIVEKEGYLLSVFAELEELWLSSK